jgi:Uma2 family endonuclease
LSGTPADRKIGDRKINRNPIFLSALPVPFCGFAALGLLRLFAAERLSMFRDDRPRVNDDGYLAGPPELIVEVAASSTSIDLRDKRRACCRNGVREYLI